MLHICLGGYYTDNWSYQDNLLPKELQSKGVENIIITTTSSFDGKYKGVKKTISYFLDGIKVIRIPATKNRFRNFFYSYNIFKLICKEKPDCIFVHGVQVCSGVYAVKYKKKVNKDCVLLSDNHAIFVNSPIKQDFIHKFLYSIRNKKIRRCCREYDAIWGVTPECIDYFERVFNISSKGIELLPLGHSVSQNDLKDASSIKSQLRSKHNIPSDSVVLITGGKISDEKKTIELITAFKMIKRENVYLFVFGRVETSDYEDSLLKEIGDLLNKRVFMLGELSVDDYTKYYLSSDMAVFPGGQSVLWQQAIGCGLPLILDKQQNVDYLDVGGNVCFANDSNPQSILNAINLCLNENHFKEMAMVARTKGYDFFSYSRIADTVINKYYEVCNENKSR